MSSRKRVGDLGERIACGYLEKKGCVLISRNFRTKFGEIDIIAESPHKTLLFIEVKTITSLPSVHYLSGQSYPHFSGSLSKLSNHGDSHLLPEDHMNPHKIKSLSRICEWYANQFPKLSTNGYQIDLIAIILDSLTLEVISLKHYENVVSGN